MKTGKNPENLKGAEDQHRGEKANTGVKEEVKYPSPQNTACIPALRLSTCTPRVA